MKPSAWSRAGTALVLDSNSSSAISPRASRSANAGMGMTAGRQRTRASVRANSALVAGEGATVLIGPRSELVSSA